MSQAEVARILALSVEERLCLIDIIWQSLSAESEQLPISDEQLLAINESW